MSTADRLAAAWQQHRSYLVATAARILSDRIEAEDVVQDAFARLAAQQVAEIADLRAWLVVVVRRLALDRLGSAHHRLTRQSDPQTFPLAATEAQTPDPADRVTLDDEVSRALTVVLDQLSPAERSTFLLHDVFGISYQHIAEFVDRTPGACRQLASRARRSLRDRDRRPPGPAVATNSGAQAVVRRFIEACSGGDLDALVRVLHSDVSARGTLDGRTIAHTVGVDGFADRLMRHLGPRSGRQLAPLALDMDGGVGIVASRDGELVVMIRLDVDDGRVRSMHAVVLPAAVRPKF